MKNKFLYILLAGILQNGVAAAMDKENPDHQSVRVPVIKHTYDLRYVTTRDGRTSSAGTLYYSIDEIKTMEDFYKRVFIVIQEHENSCGNVYFGVTREIDKIYFRGDPIDESILTTSPEGALRVTFKVKQ